MQSKEFAKLDPGLVQDVLKQIVAKNVREKTSLALCDIVSMHSSRLQSTLIELDSLRRNERIENALRALGRAWIRHYTGMKNE